MNSFPTLLEATQLAQAGGGQVVPRNNAGTCTLTTATNDHEAISSWLAQHLESPCTLSTYRREGERLLLWLAARQQRLQELTVESMLEYRSFLRNPLPRSRWCLQQEPRTLEDGTPNLAWRKVRAVRRTLPSGEPNPAWRPFISGLSATAASQSETILFGLFEFLASVGYLAANPLRAVKRRQPRAKREIERYLDQDLWRWLLGYIERMHRVTKRSEAHYQRTRFLVGFLYLLGLRISEMAAATTAHLIHKRGQWWLRVNGKGSKEGDVPLPADAEQLLRDYRASLGRSPWPHADLSEPLVMDICGAGRPLTSKAIHQSITTFFTKAAEEASPEHARVLRQATTHWLRHTDASHQIAAGVPLIVVRDNLRHASVTTTEGYVHVSRDHQHLQTQKHQLRREQS